MTGPTAGASFFPTGVDAAIAAVLKAGGAHMVPVLEAARDRGVALIFIRQDGGSLPFLRPVEPFVALVGDDTNKALGPAGFDRKALKRLVRSSHAGLLISSKAYPALYRAAAWVAGCGRRNVILIETRVEQEIPWLDFLRRRAPRLPLLVSGVKGGTA